VRPSRVKHHDDLNAPEDFQLVTLDPTKIQKRKDPDLVRKLINLSQGSLVKLAVLRKRKRTKAGNGPIQLDLFDTLQ